MKTITRTVALLGMVASLFVGTHQAVAQDQGQGEGRGGRGGGGFDPEQLRQRMNERMREQFAVTDDAEWKIISERIEKVAEARRATSSGAGGIAALFGRGGGGGRPGGEQAGGQGGRGGRGGFGGGSSPEADALQKAIDDKAGPEDLKAKLAKLRESRKAAEVNLAKAQGELKEVLDSRQEAVAVLMGLLP